MWTVPEHWITYSKLPRDRRAFTERLDSVFTVAAYLYGFMRAIFPFYTRWISSVLPYIQGPRVLEVSFGPGYLMQRYASHYDVWGIDFNQHMVQLTRKRLSGIVPAERIIRGNVVQLPYPDAFFDTLVNTLAFTAYPDGQRALQEMLRVVKPGGCVLIVDIDYPTDRNILGYALVKISVGFGDIIKPIDQLIHQQGVSSTSTPIGGFGSIRLYRITK